MSENFIISGIHVGEHGFVPETLVQEFEARGIDKLSFMVIRPNGQPVDDEYFYRWAQWCRDNEVYFMYLYTVQHAPKGKKSYFTPEMVAKIKSIAGKYFIGDMLGELGTVYGARPHGYGPMIPENMPDLVQCRDYFLDSIKKYMDIDRDLDIPNIVPGEATAMIKYTYDAGATLGVLEMMPGDPEFLVSLTRGCAHTFGHDLWGTYVAQEWYGGIRNDDPLKEKRMKVAYGYTYLSGSHIICLESGDEMVSSYGYRFGNDHPICKAYRETVNNYEQFIRSNPRIAPEPERKVALLYGNLDAYTGYMGTSIWEQYDRDDWSWRDPEWSWRITEELHHSRSWQDVENYGDEDLSGAPAYGLYDVIPAEAPVDKLKKYDTLVFIGWNSMTPEIWENLKEYVAGGGHLMMTAAHLNTNITRDGKYLPINDGKTSDFLGFDIAGFNKVNLGVKFIADSLKEGVKFPVIHPTKGGDPILAAGTVHAVKSDITTAQTTAIWSDTFEAPAGGEQPAVLENKYGKGVVTVLAVQEYPGHGSVYPLYRAMVRELMTASHRKCDVKVVANDKLRFSVYRSDKEDMIVLLNTDFSSPVNVKISAHGKTVQRTLQPCELSYEKIAR